MKLTIGQLRRFIQEAIREGAGGITLPHMPVVRNGMGPEFADREQLNLVSRKDIDDPDDVAPHLRRPIYDEEDTWGPVPPTGKDPYVLPDPYVKDSGVLPTPPIKR